MRVTIMPKVRRFHTAENLDHAVLEYIRWFAGAFGGSFCRRVVSRPESMFGRSIVLVHEGVPLIDYREEVVAEHGEGWRFRAWTQDEPVPIEVDGKPLSLGGRVRWHSPDNEGPWPEDSWLKMVRSYLDGDLNRVALFYDFFGRSSDTYCPEGDPDARPFKFVRAYDGVYHLLTQPDDVEGIEFAWNAATELGGEGIGHLTAVPPEESLSSGDDITSELLDELVAHTVATAVAAFDGGGVLMWVAGSDGNAKWTKSGDSSENTN